MKKYIIPIILGLLTGLLIYGAYHKGYKKGISKAVETIIERRDTLTLFDTLKVVEPKYIAVKTVDTIRVPVPVQGKTDTVWAELPREQKVYQDSTYLAYVSGYAPQLDSIDVFRKTTTITVTNTIKEYTNPRWSIGVQAGYGASKAGLSPYVGVGIQYNLVSFGGR